MALESSPAQKSLPHSHPTGSISTLRPKRAGRKPRARSSTGLLLFLLTAIAGILVWWSSAKDKLFLAAPLALSIVIAAGFFWVLLARSNGTQPWFEIGAMYCTVICLYTIIPIFMQVRRDEAGIQLMDGRFSDEAIDATEMAHVAWLHVAYLASFAAVYLFVRGRCSTRLRWEKTGKQRYLKPVAFYLIAAVVTMQTIAFLFELRGGGYADSYVRINQMSDAPRYIFAIAQGAAPTLSILLLMLLYLSWPRSAPLIFLIVGVTVVESILTLGSRTDAACLGVGALALYHHIVKPIRALTAAVIAASAILTFSVIGLVRNESSPEEIAESITASGGEFEAVFSNALDLSRKRTSTSGTEIPLSDYLFSDFVQVIPRHLLPFEKFDHSSWYVETYYPWVAKAGGGFAFGAISEAVVGYGFYDVLVRAAILGLLMGYLHRKLASRPVTLGEFAFYIWATVFCYQCFRDTSFSFIYLYAHRFLLVYFLVEGTVRLNSQSFRPSRERSPSVRPGSRVRGELPA